MRQANVTVAVTKTRFQPQHQHLRAIETYAYGCRFRSRLEARWAVFFTELGLDWEYEPQGFYVDGEAYLPDFKVQSGDLVYWYEVKPRETKSCGKYEKFAELIRLAHYENEWESQTSSLTRLVSGDPFDVFEGWHLCPRCGMPEAPTDDGDEFGFLCHPCDMMTTSGGGNPEEIGFAGVEYYPHKGWIQISKENYTYMKEKIEKAYLAARRARFEHGEQP